MMSPKQQHRLIGALLLILASMAAVALVVLALRENMHFFFKPLELGQAKVAPGTQIRVGGIVREGSIVRKEGLNIEFLIRDFKSPQDLNQDLKVAYAGLLPDLFREGQGIVVSGRLESPSFLRADEVLAKHDENYKPAE